MLKREWENTRLASDEQRDGVPKLEGMSANGIPQCASGGAWLQSTTSEMFLHQGRQHEEQTKLAPSFGPVPEI